MPKKPKAPETFDEYVGDVVHAHMRRKGWSQADLADATGIPLTLIGRSIRGTRGLSVQEFERIAGVLARPETGEDPDTKAAVMIQEVLTAFGGMGKLLTEHPAPEDTRVSAAPTNLDIARRQRAAASMTTAELESQEKRAANNDEGIPPTAER